MFKFSLKNLYLKPNNFWNFFVFTNLFFLNQVSTVVVFFLDILSTGSNFEISLI